MIYLGEHPDLARLHSVSVKGWFMHIKEDVQRKIQEHVMALPGMKEYAFDKSSELIRYEWLERFILADLSMMDVWVHECPEKLQFEDFYNLYMNKFANGKDSFVDTGKSYNAFVLQEKLGVDICPYCDDTRIQVLEDGGRKVRTGEFDHFYPKAKDKYPALAMCFYNLVVSCHTCNKIKLESSLGESPYSKEIESHSRFIHNIDVGINIDSFPKDEFHLKLQTTDGMVVNDSVLALNKRYSTYASEALELLSKAQKYPSEKLEEIAKLTVTSDVDGIRRDLFGASYEEGRLKLPRQKMKKDIIGY